MSSRATPPPLGTPPEPRLPPVHRVTLGSGLDVLCIERRELPVIDMRFVVRGGASGDPPAQAGRAHLLGELIDQGTQSRSALDIAYEVERLGASLQARASWDSIVIALHVLEPRIDPALELLADVATRATIPDDEFDRRRAERMAALLQERNEPRALANRRFHHAVYGDAHAFGAPLGGTAETVASLTAAAIRDLHAELFEPHRAFLVAVGDFEAGSLIDRLEKRFGTWSGGAGMSQPDMENRAVLPQNGRSVHIVARPDAPQSELRVGLAGPPRSTGDYFPLLVANTVLGGAFTSRLNMRLREEKAYTYGAGSSFALRAGGGPFVASTAVATAATADAVNDIVSEIARLGREPVSEAELERARRYMVLGLPRLFETTGDVAERVAEVELHGLGGDWYDRYAANVRSVDAESVQAAAARWLRPEWLKVALAGDAAAVRGDLETLGIGAVHVHEND